MSNQYLKLRRSNVQGRIPTTESIDFGEIALNTFDGKAYMKVSGSSGITVVPIGSNSGSFSGSFTGIFSGSFSGSGTNLFGIPASGIVGLNLSQISSGSYSASISENGLLVNTRVVANSFTGSLFGTASWANNALTASTSLNVRGNTNQIAFFDSNNSITSSANLSFSNNRANLTGSLTILSSGTEAINLGTSATGLDQPVDIRLASGNARGLRIYASDNELTVTPNGAGFQFFSNNSVNFPGQVYFDSAANNNAAIIFRTSQTSQIIQERMRITSAGNIMIGSSTDSGFKLDVNGTTRLQNTLTISSGGATITGALNASNITGSLHGTASWARNALTSSFITSSNVYGPFGSNSVISSSYALSASHASVASSVTTLNQNVTISGSLTVTNNLTVLGSASITYISESTLNIGTNLITVNTTNPGARFGGLSVIDSGSSPQISASFLYDSIKDEFVFVHHSIPITSSVFLQGPETYNNLGNEIYLTANRIPKGTGAEHLNDSNISDNGSVVSINSNTQITGSLIVSNGITGSFSGSGANLFDIPASGIVGLNLSQISSGSVSASISPNNGLQVNTGVTAPSFSGSFSGSGANLSGIPASGIVGLNLSQIASGSVSASISPNSGLQVNTNVTAPSFTGSLFGTASWSQNAVTSSYTLDAASQNTNFQQIFLLMGG